MLLNLNSIVPIGRPLCICGVPFQTASEPSSRRWGSPMSGVSSTSSPLGPRTMEMLDSPMIRSGERAANASTHSATAGSCPPARMISPPLIPHSRRSNQPAIGGSMPPMALSRLWGWASHARLHSLATLTRSRSRPTLCKHVFNRSALFCVFRFPHETEYEPLPAALRPTEFRQTGMTSAS